MPRKKYFTPQDVDQLIPKLEGIFDHILACKAKAEMLTRSSLSVITASPVTASVQPQVAFWLEAIEDNVNYVYSLGGITKDVEGGLVDFPARIQGIDVWLCWKKGESKVNHWHNLDEGFSQRQSLHPPQVPGLSH